MNNVTRVNYGDLTSSVKANSIIGAVSIFDSDFTDINQNLMSRQRKYDRKRVRTFLESPHSNIVQLQEISRYLTTVSGNYFRIIKYLSGMSTLDHFLSPSFESIEDLSEDSIEEFIKTAFEIKKLNIKSNFRWILEKLILNGEVYLYEIETKDGVIPIEIPNNWCRVGAISSDGVYRYDINTTGLREEDLLNYPKEIQQALTKDTRETSGWYRVSEAGYCFNILGAFPKGFPLLSFMFDDIMGLEDTKDLIDNKTKLDAIKLIHQKIPLDKNDTPVFNMDIARRYHEATKRNLPDGVAVTTNPLTISHVPFDKAQAHDVDAIERSERNLWNSAGISDLLFSNNKSGGEVMKLSVIADETLIFPFIKMFESYINSKITNKSFVCKLLPITFYNRKDRVKEYEESMYSGAGRMRYLASLGYEPYEIISNLKFEQEILDIDSLMIPKKTSHTLSGDDSDKPVTLKQEDGRPTNESVGKEISDKTEEIKKGE